MRNLRFIFLVFLSIVAFTGCNANFYINSNNNLSADFSNEINIVNEVDVKETQVAEPDANPITESDTKSNTESDTESDTDTESYITCIKVASFFYVFVWLIFLCHRLLGKILLYYK